jgi:hypothetical protein
MSPNISLTYNFCDSGNDGYLYVWVEWRYTNEHGYVLFFRFPKDIEMKSETFWNLHRKNMIHLMKPNFFSNAWMMYWKVKSYQYH